MRFWTRAVFVALLALMGFFSAVLLAGCGGGGTAGSGTRSGTLANRTTRTETIAATPTASTDTVEAGTTVPTQTRVAATVTETHSVTETKPVITATTTTLTETRPSLTVNTSTTVVTVTPPTTTASAETGSSTDWWVWVVIVLFAGTVIGLMVALIRRRPSELPLQERRRILDGAVASWTGNGWMIESQTESSAILTRDGERTMIAVDGAGHVTSGRLAEPGPPG